MVSGVLAMPCTAGPRSTLTELSLAEQCVDNFSRGWVNLACLPELTQMVSSNIEQAGFYSRGAAQPPQQTANRSTSSRSTAD